MAILFGSVYEFIAAFEIDEGLAGKCCGPGPRSQQTSELLVEAELNHAAERLALTAREAVLARGTVSQHRRRRVEYVVDVDGQRKVIGQAAAFEVLLEEQIDHVERANAILKAGGRTDRIIAGKTAQLEVPSRCRERWRHRRSEESQLALAS